MPVLKGLGKPGDYRGEQIVSIIGRNDPCLCGSGRKFKRCCLGKLSAGTGRFTLGERNIGLKKLLRFSARPEFGAGLAAYDLFWAHWLSERSEEEIQKVMALEQTQIAYNSWFVFDFDLGEGRTMLDLFLEREGERMSTGERNYLEGMRKSHLRLYEVLEVELDQGIELRDVWEGGRMWVRERLATHDIAQWDLIAARVGEGEDGVMVLEAAPYMYPVSAKEDILKELKNAHRRFTSQFPGKDLVSFFKWVGTTFHHLWLKWVAFRPLPKMVTAEGDSLVLAKVIFDVVDRNTLVRALRSHPALDDHGDGSYAWLESVGGFQRSLGTFIFQGNRLVLETTSRQRAERGRNLLGEIAGGAVKFRATRYEDVGQALKARPGAAKRQGPEIPSDLQAKLVGEYYEGHYRKWLDEPVPALGNRTPRHAARLKTVQPKLIALLKDFENHSERQRRAGSPAYDFSWMWAELGLSRK